MITISDNTGKMDSLAGFVLLIGFELIKSWSSIAFGSANDEISLTYFWVNENEPFVKYLFKYHNFQIAQLCGFKWLF